MSDLTNIVKNSAKGKLVYTDYRIAFDGAGWWIFSNDFARNVAIFISSSQADNCKNNSLVLSDGPTDVINGSTVVAEQKFSINFSKARTKFCLSLH